MCICAVLLKVIRVVISQMSCKNICDLLFEGLKYLGNLHICENFFLKYQQLFQFDRYEMLFKIVRYIKYVQEACEL